MASINRFNPLNFFNRLSTYASQARGTFKILNIPEMWESEASNYPAFDRLKNGIVATGFTIPTQQLSTYSPFSYNGPTIDVPHTQIFTDLDVQFILTGTSIAEANELYYTFTKWQEEIAGLKTFSRVSVGDKVPVSLTGDSVFLSRYYSDYIVQASMEVYSPSGEKTIEIIYHECYPKTIGSLQTSWESPDVPLSLTVSFGYYYPVVTRLS